MNDILSALLYIIVFAVSAVLVSLGVKRKNKYIVIAGLFIPILLAGLRYNVGLDYNTYLLSYADMVNPLATQRYNGSDGIEASFWFISTISNIIFQSPIAMFMIYGALTIVPFYFSLKTLKTKQVGIAMFIFLSIIFLNSFNIVRQGAAIGLGSLAISYFVMHKNKKAILWSLLAVSMHKSALVLIGVLAVVMILRPFIRRASKKQLITATIFIGLFVSLFINQLINLLFSSMLSINAQFSYLLDIPDFVTISFGNIYKALSIIFAIYLLIVGSKKIMNECEKELMVLLVLGFIFSFLGMMGYVIMARVGMYTLATAPIAIGYSLDRIQKKTLMNNMIRYAAIVYPVLYLLAVCVVQSDGLMYEYKTVMDNKEYQYTIEELGI
jgi:hypothetical protein